jgi:predicted nucleic acid-binding protein
VNTTTCVDTSFAIKLVLWEEGSLLAKTMWESWVAENVRVIAPCHLVFEGTSVIRNRIHRRLISAPAGEQAFEAFLAQDIELVHPNGFEKRAWELAQRFDRPTAYDACYLAVAEAADCELWTADGRLYRAVHDSLQWVRLLGGA